MIARARGSIVRTFGQTLVAALPAARVGASVRVVASDGHAMPGRVAAVERGRAIVIPSNTLRGVAPGDVVEVRACEEKAVLGFGALGRAIGPAGEPLDGGAALRGSQYALRPSPLVPSQRVAIERIAWTGIRAIDGLLTIGRGARVGLFGPPGSGKSQLVEAIADATQADAVVVALIGERGREAERWFARRTPRTTIVCATSDRPAAERVRAAETALAHAAALRSRDLHVLVAFDSLARYATAARDLRCSLGEPLGRGGFPPGVWNDVARLLEIAGATAHGSVTLVATILSEGDDDRDPLAIAARSLLDGHLVLSSALAHAGRFPAIDVLASASRTMRDVVDAETYAAAATVRRGRHASRRPGVAASRCLRS